MRTAGARQESAIPQARTGVAAEAGVPAVPCNGESIGMGLMLARAPAPRVRMGKVAGADGSYALAYACLDYGDGGVSVVGRCVLSTDIQAGDILLFSNDSGRWTCAATRPGSETYWLRTADITPIPTPSNPTIAAWTGTWTYAGDEISIRQTPHSQDLEIVGHGSSRGGEFSRREGSFGVEGTPTGDQMSVNSSDCEITMWLLGDYLAVEQHKSCNLPANIAFGGVYRRKMLAHGQ